jgi:putative membrane protein
MSAVGAPQPAADRLLALPAREVALLGLLHGRGLVVVGAAFGVLWELGLVDWISRRYFDAEAAGRGVLRQLALALVGQSSAPTRRILLMLAVFVAFVAAMRALSVVLALVRFHGFVLTRAREELRSEFGLLTRVTATIPTRRIQTLTVQRAPLHRLFRRAAVRVDTAGGHTEQQVQAQRQWLAPIVREQALAALLREILPVADVSAVDWQAVHPHAFRRAVRRSLAAAVILSFALVALLEWWTLAALAILSLWAAVATRRYVTSLRWALTDNAIVFRSGWLWSYLTVAPLAKVQAVSLHESPFDRRYGMATVLADTAGGHDAPHRVRIPYLARDVAHTLRDRLVASAASTAFKW